jgi:microcystin-dependent protein
MADPYIGEIRLFAFPRVPTGWNACDGSSLAISEYETLYTLIGTTYGGNGTTTFNVPDLRGRVPISQGTVSGQPTYVLGQSAGEESHTLLDAEMPAHSHPLISTTNAGTTKTPATNVHLATASPSGNLYAPPTGVAPYDIMGLSMTAAGGSVSHNNVMPTLVGNFCISLFGVFPSAG